LVPKRDGGMRFCVDYRKLKNLTERDVYPLPRLDECIDSPGDAVVFSTLDANSGYWQVSMHPCDRDKNTLTCHVGIFRFKRIPFGLRNAPSTFQRAMDVILSGVHWQKYLCYLDDIIVFSSSMESHVEDLDKVLSLLRDAGVSLRLDKCHFFRRRANYLGHVIEPGKLSVQATKVDNILKAKLPRTKTELRAFLGICNVYRRFVPKFETIAAPLRVIYVRILPIPSIFKRARMPLQLLNSSDQRLRPLRHSRCQNKVLSMSWIHRYRCYGKSAICLPPTA
jgi:hypothetical protein